MGRIWGMSVHCKPFICLFIFDWWFIHSSFYTTNATFGLPICQGAQGGISVDLLEGVWMG